MMSNLAQQYDFFDKRRNYTETKTERTKKKWLRCPEAMKRYSVSRPTITSWAVVSGARHKIGGAVLIDTEIIDKYLETFRIPGEIC